MSDRPVNELPVKTAAQLALTDYLLGQGDDTPAAFRSQMSALVEFFGAQIAAGTYIFERGSNANGEYVRFADGTQICTGLLSATYNNSRYLQGTWTYPAAFLSGSQVTGALGPLPVSGGQYLGGLNLNNLGRPFQVGGPGVTTFTGGVYNNDAPFVGGHAINNIPIVAIGRWK